MPSKTPSKHTRWDAVPLPDSLYLIEQEVSDREPLPLDFPTAVAILLLRWLLYGEYLFRRYKMLATIPSPGRVRTAWLGFLLEIGARFGQAMALYLVFRREKAWQPPRHRLVGTESPAVTNLYGSGYVMRRSALNIIGGWPLVPSAEDLYCGHLLAGEGWKIAFCWDICQHDLTLDSLDALVSQRLRWTEGDFNLSRKFNFFIPGLNPG
ncbi:hypothetical protein BDW62DRAFT_201896 [Aspergillus aurantiobrunneus]